MDRKKREEEEVNLVIVKLGGKTTAVVSISTSRLGGGIFIFIVSLSRNFFCLRTLFADLIIIPTALSRQFDYVTVIRPTALNLFSYLCDGQQRKIIMIILLGRRYLVDHVNWGIFGQDLDSATVYK